MTKAPEGVAAPLEKWPEPTDKDTECVDVIWFRNHKPEIHALWHKFDAPLNTNVHWLKFAETCMAESKYQLGVQKGINEYLRGEIAALREKP